MTLPRWGKKGMKWVDLSTDDDDTDVTTTKLLEKEQKARILLHNIRVMPYDHVIDVFFHSQALDPS